MTKEQQFRDLVNEFETATINMTEFCRVKQVTVYSFKYWRLKIKSESQPKGFLSVQKEQPVTTDLEIIYPNGVKIKLDSKLQTELLHQLIRLY